MKLRKQFICGMMLFSFLIMPTTTALADTDETQETEKLYMNDTVYMESPINVIINDKNTVPQTINIVDDEYTFEKDLSLVNPMQLFEDNSEKVTSVINNHAKRTIIIDKGAYQLINEFVDTYLDVYITKVMPDMNPYYELSNNIREQNKLSVESYIYKDALAKSNDVKDIDYTINIAEVTPVTENVNEVLFYLERTFHTNEGDERGGTWFLTQIVNAEDGYKILNVWIQNYEFEMMQDNLKDRYLSKNIELEKNVIKQDIFKECEENKARNLTKLLADDLNEPDDKLGNSIVPSNNFISQTSSYSNSS